MIAISNWDADPGGSGHGSYSSHPAYQGFAVDVVPSGGETILTVLITVELGAAVHQATEVAMNGDTFTYAGVVFNPAYSGSQLCDSTSPYGTITVVGSFSIETQGARILVNRRWLGYAGVTLGAGHSFTAHVYAWGDAGTFVTGSQAFSDGGDTDYRATIANDSPTSGSTIGANDPVSFDVVPPASLGNVPIKAIIIENFIGVGTAQQRWDSVFGPNGGMSDPQFPADYSFRDDYPGSSITPVTDLDGNISYTFSIVRVGGALAPFQLSVFSETTFGDTRSDYTLNWIAPLVVAAPSGSPGTAVAAQFTYTSQVSAGDEDFGSDILVFEDLDGTMTPVSDKRVLAEAIARRFLTQRGSLPFHPDYGSDVRDYISEGIDLDVLQRIKISCESEAEKEERVESATCTVTFDPPTFTLSILTSLTTAVGPFAFTLNVSKLSATLLEAQ